MGCYKPQAVVFILNVSTVDNTISFTPSPQFLDHVQFKKLPFYEVIGEIIKPTLLTGIEKCTLPNFPKGSYIFYDQFLKLIIYS